MKTGIADLPLHYGSCPRWLFGRMKNLGKSISEIIILEFGKDGYPYPVDRKTYDKSIEILKIAVENAKIGNKEKIEAIKRLNSFLPNDFK